MSKDIGRALLIKEIRAKIEGLQNIPASEQGIGYLQVAVQEILGDILDEVEKLQKVVGYYHG